MINQVCKLVAPGQFEVFYAEETLKTNKVIVRPTNLSICVADLRYYSGRRDPEVLRKKLPLALIHEAIGEVVYDPSGEFEKGTEVIMIPNTPTEIDEINSENYLRTSLFRSSSQDGFLQNVVFMDKDRLVPTFDEMNSEMAAFTELVSVAMHGLKRFEKKSHARKETIGIWGNGSLGYITALFAKRMYPESKIIMFGRGAEKLSYFSFVDETHTIDEDLSKVQIDHAIECVGGINSQNAIEQIIDLIKPEGTISLLGVSEHPVEINTRMVLEKGLTLIGSSRSGRQDFIDTVTFLKENKDLIDYLNVLVSQVIPVSSTQELSGAFEESINNNWGKTIIKWNY